MSSKCTSIKPDQYCIEQWKIDLILKTFHAYYGQLVWLGWRPVKTLKLHSYWRKQYTIAWIEAFGGLHKCRQVNLYFSITICQLCGSKLCGRYLLLALNLHGGQLRGGDLCDGELRSSELRGTQFTRYLVYAVPSLRGSQFMQQRVTRKLVFAVASYVVATMDTQVCFDCE